MEPEKKDALSTEIDRVLNYIRDLDPDSEEYGKATENLRILYEARSKKRALIVDMDTLVLAATNLIMVGLILRHEQFNVITTRALALIRPR